MALWKHQAPPLNVQLVYNDDEGVYCVTQLYCQAGGGGGEGYGLYL
jgi:hypothetical protein